MGVVVSGAFSATSGGKVYGYNNISTTPQEIVPANSQRAQIIFHNPSDTDIYVAPAVIVNPVTLKFQTLTPSIGALGGCFKVYSNGGYLSVAGECQTAWQAFSASATGKAFTIMDSNT